MIIAIVVFILVIIAIARYYHQNYVSLKFKYEIYSLRDNLRMAAIENRIDKDDQLFEYFDVSFSRVISESYYITLFRVIFLFFMYGDDKSVLEVNKIIDEETKKNPFYDHLRNEYHKCLRNYMVEQHYISFTFIIKPLSKIILSPAMAASKFKSILKGSFYLPEISASGKHKFI